VRWMVFKPAGKFEVGIFKKFEGDSMKAGGNYQEKYTLGNRGKGKTIVVLQRSGKKRRPGEAKEIEPQRT